MSEATTTDTDARLLELHGNDMRCMHCHSARAHACTMHRFVCLLLHLGGLVFAEAACAFDVV